MQEPFRNKKSRGYRLRPATGRDRLDSRVRRICSRLGILAVVVAAAIVIRSLYNIQIIHGAEYRQYAAQQQLLDTTIKATRGEIYDASGITLASTSVVWTIWADPSYSSILYTSKTNDDGTVTKTLDPAMCAEVSRELTLRLLSGDGESMDSVDTSSAEYQQQYQTVYDALSRLDSAYVTLATKVNNAVKLSIEKYVTSFNKAHKKATDTSRKGRISVSSEKSFQRNYPYGAFAAAVLGFTDADGVGTYGLEKSYQSTLAGVDGRTITQRNAVGNAIADANATTFAAKDGSNLVLSLDVNVQEIAERYLNEAIAANTVENRGCAIVMNVKTGAILAMASKPDFDPNAPLDFSENLAYLNEQEKLHKPAFYILIGEDEVTKPQAYIGETENFKERVKDHDSKKAFWQKALVFVSKDEDMTKADVQYLEYRAIVVAKQSNSFVLNENKQIPKAPNLPEHQRDAMDEFFEDIRFLASFIGCDIFEISQPKEEHLFYTKARGCNAKGFYNSAGFTVLKGSIIANNCVPSFTWKAKREKMVEEYATLNNGVWIMDSDKTFSSPSTAADFCIGRPANGWNEWKDKDGNTLDFIYRKQLE